MFGDGALRADQQLQRRPRRLCRQQRRLRRRRGRCLPDGAGAVRQPGQRLQRPGRRRRRDDQLLPRHRWRRLRQRFRPRRPQPAPARLPAWWPTAATATTPTRASTRAWSEAACNGLDDDCNAATADSTDGDGDGSNSCFDCNDANPSVFPGATETCNQADDDCDGNVDEGLPVSEYWPDADNDGFGGRGRLSSTSSCSGIPAGFVGNNSDCNDFDGSVSAERARSHLRRRRQRLQPGDRGLDRHRWRRREPMRRLRRGQRQHLPGRDRDLRQPGQRLRRPDRQRRGLQRLLARRGRRRLRRCRLALDGQLQRCPRGLCGQQRRLRRQHRFGQPEQPRNPLRQPGQRLQRRHRGFGGTWTATV